jgi:hypothetical protein
MKEEAHYVMFCSLPLLSPSYVQTAQHPFSAILRYLSSLYLRDEVPRPCKTVGKIVLFFYRKAWGDHLEDVSIDEKVILKWVLKK